MRNLMRYLGPAKPPAPPVRSPSGSYVIYRDPPGYGNGRDYWLLGQNRGSDFPRTIRIIAGSNEDFMISSIGRTHVSIAFDDSGNVASITRPLLPNSHKKP